MKTIKIIFTLSIFLLMADTLFAQPAEQWIRRYNHSGQSADETRFISVDNSGNTVVTGINGNDIVTVKYNSAGTLLWTHFLYDTGTVEINGLAIDNTGSVIIAGCDGGPSLNIDMLIFKISSGGVTQWLTRYNSAFDLTDKAAAMVIDNSGNIFVSGYSAKTATTTQLTTIKFNSAGVQQWVAAQNTNTAVTRAKDIDIDPSGNIYVCGSYGVNNSNEDAFLYKISPAGTFVFFTPYNNTSVTGPDAFISLIINSAATDVFVSGFSDSTVTSTDQITARYNSAGVRQWLMRYNGPGNGTDLGQSIVLDSAGNVFSAGSSRGSGSAQSDIEISKYSPAGTPMGYQRYNVGSESESFVTMKTDAAKNIYIAGFKFSGSSGIDVLILKYNPALTMIWSKTYDGVDNNNDLSSDLALDNSGNIYLAGTTYMNSTNIDYLTIKYSQPVGLTGNSEEIPAAFRLEQNYPNPFNPNTEITFDIPTPEMVNITVFDITGREVAVLADEFLYAGSYKVRFDASGLSSGLYFFSLQAGSFKDVKKMVLVK